MSDRVPAPGAVLDLLLTTCCIVTAHHDGVVGGCLVGSVMPVGVDGRRLVVALSAGSTTGRLVAASRRLAVHVLSAADTGLARRFGAYAGGADKFAGIPWRPDPDGLPLLDAGLAVLTARAEHSWSAGDLALHQVVATAAAWQDAAARRPFTIADAWAAGLEQPRSAATSPMSFTMGATR